MRGSRSILWPGTSYRRAGELLLCPPGVGGALWSGSRSVPVPWDKDMAEPRSQLGHHSVTIQKMHFCLLLFIVAVGCVSDTRQPSPLPSPLALHWETPPESCLQRV